jgi:hypothetical protein
MIRTKYKRWILETSGPHRDRTYTAWIYNPKRHVIGYGQGTSESDAVARALCDAGRHALNDLDALNGIEDRYFGREG